MYIGYAVAESPGASSPWLAPSCRRPLFILGVTMVLHRLRREAWLSSFVEGLAPAISVLMLFTAWKIFENGGSDRMGGLDDRGG
jgi:chromate transport protein ChrA